MRTPQRTTSITLLYPDATPAELAEIEGAFEQYLKLVIRIADGALADPALAEAIDVLTAEPSARTLENERSNIESGKTSNV